MKDMGMGNSRFARAVVRMGSMKTISHQENSRLLGIMMLGFSYRY